MIPIPYGYSKDYTVGKVAHQMQDFQLDKHQKTFGGRALPGPAGEFERSPDPLAAQRGPTSKGRGSEGREGEGRGS